MSHLPTKQLPRERGVPYTMHEILMERIRFEEQFYTQKAPPPELPKFEQLPKLKLTPVSALVLGRQMMKRSLSIVLP